jgi:hypothetical protein
MVVIVPVIVIEFLQQVILFFWKLVQKLDQLVVIIHPFSNLTIEGVYHQG